MTWIDTQISQWLIMSVRTNLFNDDRLDAKSFWCTISARDHSKTDLPIVAIGGIKKTFINYWILDVNILPYVDILML